MLGQNNSTVAAPLSKLFCQEGASQIRRLANGKETKDFRIQHTIAKYLSAEDVKNVRKLNKFCNNWMMECPRFINGMRGKISDSWHKQIAGFNLDTTIRFRNFHIIHFAFRRTSVDFPRYLVNAAMHIKDLKISNSTLGSLAISCILNSCRNLESLTLDAVRFRDVDQISDYDSPLLLEKTLPKNGPEDTGYINEALRMRRAFKYLTISNTFILEHCSMVQIMDRSQYLQSISLINCFKPSKDYDPKKGINRGISFHERCKVFMECFKDLLDVNRHSLTHLTIDDCNLDEEVLKIFAPAFHKLKLKELSLNITKSNISTPEAILKELFDPQCDWSTLEGISLEFHGNISDGHIKNLLENSADTLKDLKLIVHTNNLSKDICLKPDLSKMKMLETIYIKDAKNVTSTDLKDCRKLHSSAKLEDAPTNCVHSDLASTKCKIESDFCTAFLLSLPQTVKQISLCNIIRDTNFQEKLEKAPNISETFLNLTALEVRGPNLSSYGPKLGKLISQMTKLTSLIMSNCDITDSHLTGLSVESAHIMRKCGTYMLEFQNRMNACNQSGKCTDKLQNGDISKTFVLHSCDDSKLKNGFQFSKLKDLKHVDLSSNYGISDVTLVYSLQTPNLKSLSLEHCPKITDSGLDFIPYNLPNLQEINLRNCRRLSKHGLNRLVCSSPKVKRILTTKIIKDDDFEIDIPHLSSDFNIVVRCEDSFP